jgi:malate dehydrogenase (oxaloacetate-decarboxylating)(NADP+)
VLGIVGLVPDVTESIETQLARVSLQLKQKATDLDRYIYLMNLLEINETLFYHTLMSDPARFLDIVYDPTVAGQGFRPSPRAEVYPPDQPNHHGGWKPS